MMDLNKLIEKLGSNKEMGLTAKLAQDALSKYGENSL